MILPLKRWRLVLLGAAFGVASLAAPPQPAKAVTNVPGDLIAVFVNNPASSEFTINLGNVQAILAQLALGNSTMFMATNPFGSSVSGLDFAALALPEPGRMDPVCIDQSPDPAICGDVARDNIGFTLGTGSTAALGTLSIGGGFTNTGGWLSAQNSIPGAGSTSYGLPNFNSYDNQLGSVNHNLGGAFPASIAVGRTLPDGDELFDFYEGLIGFDQYPDCGGTALDPCNPGARPPTVSEVTKLFDIRVYDAPGQPGKLVVEVVPEPGTVFLFGTGLLGLAAFGSRRRD